MYKAIKPYAGPIILWLLERGLDLSPWSNDYLGGLLIGFAMFWGMLALFSNRALLKLYPGILDWLPFLDPSGGLATSQQLTGKYIQGQSFSISTIAYEGIVRNRTFDDCDIYGPAVIHMVGVGQVVGCAWVGKRENTLIATTSLPLGAIIFENCNFIFWMFFLLKLNKKIILDY